MAKTNGALKENTAIDKKANKKRKLEQDEETSRTQPSIKKKSIQQPVKSKKEEQVDDTVSGLAPEELGDFFTKQTSRHFPEVTGIELEDKSIPTSSFTDTTSYTEKRAADNLATFLETLVEPSSQLSTCKTISSPHTLIIASAAIRAQDLIRGVRKFGSEDNKIAKLFAKHMKLQESISYVQKTKFGIGVGTPSRVKELIEKEVLKVGDLQRIVIDASFVDDKKRSIFDTKDIYAPLLDLLNLDAVKLRLVKGDTNVIMF